MKQTAKENLPVVSSKNDEKLDTIPIFMAKDESQLLICLVTHLAYHIPYAQHDSP